MHRARELACLLALLFAAGCGDDDAPVRRRDGGGLADAGGAVDAGATPVDAGASGDAGGPVAPLAIATRDTAITPIGSARVPDLVFDAANDAYFVVYTWVLGTGFRTEARVITVDAAGTPHASAPLTIDPLASPPHNSAEASIAVPDPGSSAPALAVWSDDRLGSGSGQLEIYGQRLRATGGTSAGIGLEGEPFRISNVDVTGEVLPDVAWTGSGYYVAWADDRERFVRHEDARVVYGRMVSADGTLGAEARLGDDTLFQTYPQISRCGDRLLVAWTDYRAPGGPLVLQYRGRVLDAATGEAVGPIVSIAEDTLVPHDPPGVACEPRDGSWWVAWNGPGPPSVRQVYLSHVTHDGTASGRDEITMQSDGGMSPRLAWVAASGSLALSFHAQDTTFGYVVELAPGGAPHGPVAALTEAAPGLGTFWTSIAAHATRPEALVAATLDYNRIALTVLR